MFVVMGATGHVGSAVARTLIERGEKVRVLTRHPEDAGRWRDKGAEIAFADGEDAQSLASALEGASRAFLLNPPADPKEDTDATELRTVANILSALRNSKLEKVVAASTYGAQPGHAIGDFTTLWALEDGLRQIATSAAINRGAYYMSNWLAFADVARQSGVLPSMFPADTQIPIVAPEDLGKTAADRLLSSTDDRGIAYVEGPERYTPNDVAAAFSIAFGRKIDVQVIPREQFASNYKQAGFSEKAAQSYARMTAASLDKDFDKPASPIRGSIDLESFITQGLGNSA